MPSTQNQSVKKEAGAIHQSRGKLKDAVKHLPNQSEIHWPLI
jgi:hypothetical protein